MEAQHEQQSPEDEPFHFAEGMRVRVWDGEAAGAVGEIIAWGESEDGPEIRAGLLLDEREDDEELWVVGTEIRAIDENGDDLEPQPLVAIAPVVEEEIRAVEARYDLGRAFTALRLQRGYSPSRATSARLRLDALEETEEKLGCTIPDPIAAYVVSGLGSIREVGGIIGLTEDLLGHRAEGAETAENAAFVAFDYDNGDYLAFQRDAGREDESIAVFLHEKDYGTTDTTVMEWVTDQLDEKVAQEVQRFGVVVEKVADEEPEPESQETWVTHPKFGRGTVVASEPTAKGHKLRVRFVRTGEVRKLLDRFITYD